MRTTLNLFLITLSTFTSSCRTSSSKKIPIVNNNSIKDRAVTQEIDLINEISGTWHPISYNESIGQALTKEKILKYMKMNIYIDKNTIIHFSDSFSFTHFQSQKASTTYFLQQNVGSPDDNQYNKLSKEINDISFEGRKKNSSTGALYTTTYSLAYDGTYLLVFEDGVTFLCVRNASK
ncbi:hypothetical protein [Edaphocola flava]|uniref:hypothetical protein n=1 Tax=Edaphocola flava TaxID=2499629 RepID=UPI00100B8D81|nr:hypothetical protein [Edaphocola flava]